MRDPYDSVEAAIAAIRRGEFVMVVDDTGRENEGDLIIAAEKITSEKMAFLVRHSSGVVCVSLTAARCAELNLPLMVSDNAESQGTAFTVTVDYRHGTTTGISAADRSATLRALADPLATASDFVRPGHLFPLRAREGGILVRPGHTEAAMDLSVLAGLRPAGVLCEIVNDDGSMARRDSLERFAEKHGLVMISIEALATWRRRTEALVEPVSIAKMPTRYGLLRAHAYRSTIDGTEHLAMVCGDVLEEPSVLTRLHSECLTGDLFGSRRCDCGEQMDMALNRITREGCGVLIYMRGHEGRGIGLGRKLNAYHLQDEMGLDTVEANTALGLPVDARNYEVAAHILRDLGISSVRLMSNNPKKIDALQQCGLRVVREELIVPERKENRAYLHTKRQRMGHLLPSSTFEERATVIPLIRNIAS